MGDWLQGLSNDLGSNIEAVLLVSAHWKEEEFLVSGAEFPKLI